MKTKIFALLAFMAAFALNAQTVDFKNLDVNLNSPVYDTDNSTLLSGFTIELLAGPTGGSLTSIATTSVSSGYFFGGVQTISGVTAGNIADIIIRAYNGASFEASTVRGESTLFSVVTGGAGSPASSPGVFEPDSNISSAGLQSFHVSLAQVPEPTTIALGVMGGLALLARRRRNAA